MPELPEVETTRRGIEPAVAGGVVRRVVVRQPRLRWPVPAGLARDLPGQTIRGVRRRAKFLLLDADRGTVLMHLGMSGHLRVLERERPAEAHDHLDLVFAGGRCLRFTDPRRFGTVLWTTSDPLRHRLLADLGPEPLEPGFDGDWLHRSSRGRRCSIKQHIMNPRVVVGVGNIYASESLYVAGIHPRRAAGRVSRQRMQRLADAIVAVLDSAIHEGGTSLRDFTGSDGQPGYFQLRLRVYGREGQPCHGCGEPVRRVVLGQRSTFYCPRCQR